MEPRIKIPRLIHAKIMHMVHNSDHCECSGLMLCEVREGNIHVTDTIMTKQKNSFAETELDPAGVGKAMFKWKDRPGSLSGHWHSHVDMEAFWSATDHEMIAKNARHGWFVHIVFNKKGEYLACLSIKEPVDAFIDEIPVDIVDDIPSETVEVWNEEYKAAVELVKYTTPPSMVPLGAGYSDLDGTQLGRYMPKIQGGHVTKKEHKTSSNDVEAALEAEISKLDQQLERLDAILDDEDVSAKQKKKITAHYNEVLDKKDVLEGRLLSLEQSYLAGGLA